METRLHSGRSGDQIAVGENFSLLETVENGSGAQPASNSKGTGCLPGIQPVGPLVHHPRQVVSRIRISTAVALLPLKAIIA